MSATDLALLIPALGIDAALGEMGPVFRILPHPVVVMGRTIAILERRLNRPSRSDRARFLWGLLVAGAVPLAAAAIGVGVTAAARAVPYGWVGQVLVMSLFFAQRSLFDHVRAVGVALRAGLEPGRMAVARIVGRDPRTLDRHGVARAAIESLAENFADAVVAPVLWAVLLGLPGLMAFKAISTLDSMIGYRDERIRAFGRASARLDDLVNLIPARLAGLIIAAAALFAPGARPWRAIVTMFADHGRHPSPNSGWPEAAMAGALDLALGGPRHYPGGVTEVAWIGEGRARAEPADISRALVVYGAACLIDAGLVAALLWVSLRGW